MYVCVRACVRACVHVCVCVWGGGGHDHGFIGTYNVRSQAFAFCLSGVKTMPLLMTP